VFDESTGALTLKGDDVGMVVDGFKVQGDLYAITKRRMDKLANAYQAYFQTRFQSNSARNLNVDYFVSGSRGGADASLFDGGGTVGTTGGLEVDSQTIFAPTFGLAPADYQDGYGNAILVDNSSDAVRTPDNANAAMQSPPYTILFKARLPGTLTIAQSVVGNY